MFSKIKQRWIDAAFVVILLAVFGGAVAVLIWPPAKPAQQAEQPKPVDPNDQGAAGPEPVFAHGWVRDDDAVKAVKATLPQPVFEATPAGQVKDPLPKSAFLWEAYTKQFGSPPPPQDQNPIGSCVSFGTSRAGERSLINQIAAGERFKFQRFAEEVIYALSRVNIGGGRLRGSDGSVGAWAAKAWTEIGHVPRGEYGTLSLKEYDPNRCRQWGDSGIPASILTEAKKYTAGSMSQVKSWQEAKLALAQKYGIAVSSNVGFNAPGTSSPATRDARGICRANGSWGHCMCLDGYYVDADGKEYGHIENSWGPNAHKGPVGWGNPSTAGFWTDSATIDRMLKQGDSWALSAVKGFPARQLDWAAVPRDVPGAFARVPLRGVDQWALAH